MRQTLALLALAMTVGVTAPAVEAAKPVVNPLAQSRSRAKARALARSRPATLKRLKQIMVTNRHARYLVGKMKPLESNRMDRGATTPRSLLHHLSFGRLGKRAPMVSITLPGTGFNYVTKYDPRALILTVEGFGMVDTSKGKRRIHDNYWKTYRSLTMGQVEDGLKRAARNAFRNTKAFTAVNAADTNLW